jgi:hypothetical protein
MTIEGADSPVACAPQLLDHANAGCGPQILDHATIMPQLGEGPATESVRPRSNTCGAQAKLGLACLSPPGRLYPGQATPILTKARFRQVAGLQGVLLWNQLGFQIPR